MSNKSNNFGYVVTSEAWYARSERYATDEIMVYRSEHADGVDYEFTLKWKTLNGKPVLQVAIFEDALKAFIEMHQLFTELAVLHRTDPQKQDVIALLDKLGYKDTTERANPDIGTGSFRDPSARYYIGESPKGTWLVTDKRSGKIVIELLPGDMLKRQATAISITKILNDENSNEQ